MNENKLGVAYNLFTGFELLEHSINSIRSSVDYICVVFSLTSTKGKAIEYDFMPELKTKGLINDIVQYIPNTTLSTKSNEMLQRNLGLNICKKNQCKYFMTMDVDELYVKEEFDKAKEIVITNGYDSSACQMLSYYKYPNILIDPLEEYYVPFIYKINESDSFNPKEFPVIVDQTRICTLGKNILFKRSELQMHHMTYVRTSIREKLEHSATYSDEEKINNIEKHYKNWNPYIKESKILTFHGFFNFKFLENPYFNFKISYKTR